METIPGLRPAPLRRTHIVVAILGTLSLLAGQSGLTVEPIEDGAPRYSAPVSSLSTAISIGRVPRDIYDVLRLQSAAPILVKLNIPGGWRPEHRLTPTQVEFQRRAITDTQQRILDKLGGAGVESIKRYQYLPYLAAHATEAALLLLVQMPEVYVIRADRADPPSLAASVPFIGGDDVVNALAGAAGAGQTIAILDSGVDKSHAFLGGRVVSEGCYSTDSFWSNTDTLCPNGAEATTATGSGVPCTLARCDHGTHVAGIAAGSGSAMTGVAPGATLIAMQVFHRANRASVCAQNGETAPCIRAFASDYILALERVFALSNTFNIAAANLSLGGGSYTSQAHCDNDNEPVNDAFALLRGANIASVAASGNGARMTLPSGATQFAPGIGRPACVSNAVSVGNVTLGNTVVAGSQTAPFLSLLAPGNGIVSSVTGGGTDSKSGTSMAAPHVTGAFAVLRSINSAESIDATQSRLSGTGVLVTDNRPSTAVVTPRIQVDAAVENATGLPLVPGSLRITGKTGTTLTAEWRDNSISETTFKVRAKPVNDPQLPTRSSIVTQNVTSGAVSGLTPNKTYDVTVRACNGANQCSAESTATRITTLDTLPSIPTNLRKGTVTTSSIEVKWDFSSTNPVTSFRLRTTANPNRSWVTHTLANSKRSQTFTNLAPSSSYSFIIQACNSDGCSADSPMLPVKTQSAGNPPVAPTNLHVCGAQFLEFCFNDRTTLVWRDNANNEDRYEFEWTVAQAGVPPWQAAWNAVSLPAGRTSYSFTTLTPGMIHYFRARACNVAGCSTYSNVVTYTVP